MSWLWSSPAPEDPKDSTPEQIAHDPYASSYSNSLGQQDTRYSADSENQLGNAFSDEFDIPQESSFDIYAAPPPAYDSISPFDTNSATDVEPSVNFSTMGRIDPSIFSPRAQRRSDKSSVDYVFAEDYNDVRKKSGAEQLTYLAGTGYLTGASLGGTAGMVSALRSSAGKPARLRLNAILNATGKRGSAMANTFGVLALAFSLSESMVYNYTNDETLVNYAAAGAAAGGLFKSTRGIRVAGLWAAGGAAVALGAVYASRRGYYGNGLRGVL